MLTLQALQTITNTCANSVDPDETAHKEPSHLDLYCLPFCTWFMSYTPIRNNGCVQNQRRKRPFHKLSVEKVKKWRSLLYRINAATPYYV